jgi:hypothetical protein
MTKENFNFTEGGVFITCASHEDRCLGSLSVLDNWKPDFAYLTHYTGENSLREKNLASIKKTLQDVNVPYVEGIFDKNDLASSLKRNTPQIKKLLARFGSRAVFDISVFTRKHLLMMFNWLCDCGLSDNVFSIYTEPQEYLTSKHIPASFGVSSIESIPGMPGCANASRPLHLIVLLGSEGERAYTVVDQLQPLKTSLGIIKSPTMTNLTGITEDKNRTLINLIGHQNVIDVSPLDPEEICIKLIELANFDANGLSEFSIAICPLGTKPQILGVHLFRQRIADSVAVIYPNPIRRNYEFYSKGIGKTHLVGNSLI